mgnify:CR=1 FL=1
MVPLTGFEPARLKLQRRDLNTVGLPNSPTKAKTGSLIDCCSTTELP